MTTSDKSQPLAKKSPKKKTAPKAPKMPSVSKKAGEVPPAPEDREPVVTTMPFKPDIIQMASLVYLLWWNWADFSLTVVSPTMKTFEKPKILKPGKEFVYTIHDFGNRWTTSKQADMFAMGKSMCRLHYTIEKIIDLLIQRLKSMNIDDKTEVQVLLEGHELAQRKGFEVIINLAYNVVVANFNPGPWGEWYLRTVKNLSDKGYGFPSPAPRDTYKNPMKKESTEGPEAKSNQ